MLTHEQIERLPRDERAVVLAAQAYYWGLLIGVPRYQRQQRLEAWWGALSRRWPDICYAYSVMTDSSGRTQP